MRRKEKEIKSISEIEDIINKALICRLGLSLNNQPYVIPLNFGYKSNELHFHCAIAGKKIDFIRENNNVCFEIDSDTELVVGQHACVGWTMKYKSVIGFGKAYIIEDFDEKIKSMDIIMEHYSGTSGFEYTEKNIRGVGIIKVVIESVSGKKSGY